MREAGLVEPKPDPHDRRRTRVPLTARRAPEADAAGDAPGSAFATLLAEFGDEELRVIERYLRRSTEVGSAQAARLRER
ncbi:hypothetical protein [Streptomyces sp. enrichment culture]|uniref:hypothetical protein n=1 Tax=Streptomyces sp. enrichment culture TaxID=1795815 RepID=UPI003F568A67